MKLPIKLNWVQLLKQIKINYFISIGVLDSIDINGKKYLLVSSESPISQIFLGKKLGDEFEFRGRKIKIKNVF